MQNAKRQPESAAPLRHTTACFYFARGLCDRGASCTYAHSASDLRPKPDLSRTSLCRTFMKAGLCMAGEECMFAHGRAELRRPKKKQAAASGTTSGKQPAEHQEMSAGHYMPVTMKEPGRRSYDDNAGSMGGFGCTIKTVKNTFLHFEERVGAAVIPNGRMAKSCSVPQLMAGLKQHHPELEATGTTAAMWLNIATPGFADDSSHVGFPYISLSEA
ncbi:unnamed protein product [Polarella glacialis]|uniref:C3H1-type domain-containing protein n=1 Tax=Polarella glacialis TaxID=89957 RepID=A0A813F7F4_POLGL|nr:unnamed protein product [Polarella glacialis]